MAKPKTIIVTGASRGIGLAIVQYLIKNGHQAVLVARSESILSDLQKQHPTQIRYVAGDLANAGLGQRTVALARKEFGAIDGLCINHGVLSEMKTIANAPIGAWRRAYDINVFSAVEFVQAAIPSLRESKGSVVFTSSGASKKSSVAWGIYGSTKAVLDHLAATLASEEPDITTLAIAPGTVDTEMQVDIRDVHVKHFSVADAERFSNLKKNGLLLRPEQPGDAMARFLLAPSRSLSGKYLRWDCDELQAYRAND